MHSWTNPIQAIERLGEIEQFIGLKIIANGPPQSFVGEVCALLDQNQQITGKAEVIGFADGKVYLMPYDTVSIRMGYKVRATGHPLTIDASPALLG
ncbi:MAG: flagellum-specific ATP synthase FliI, partial [Gammaproteobacteria bacterium]|nr:flagellum-specific ATP synthase FliI [Gammaproteobacteria bacterium]